jgi:GNAT superfamily N-acetyltransferase
VTDALAIRPYRDGDHDALRRICVLTGDSGRDATGLFGDDGLLPDIFLTPYVLFEPGLARVLVEGDRPVGYIVAAADSTAFARRFRSEWLPVLDRRHPQEAAPGSRLQRLLHVGRHPEEAIGPDQALFPAHLHIDLLPEAQGAGWGRALIDELLRALRAAGVPGVQLGVGEDNTGAQAFYRRLGFAPLPSTPGDPYRLGIRTGDGSAR